MGRPWYPFHTKCSICPSSHTKPRPVPTWQVEGVTQGTRWENVLRDSFGGVLSNELLADGGKYSERSEPFYYLIVPVRMPRMIMRHCAGSGSYSYRLWFLFHAGNRLSTSKSMARVAHTRVAGNGV